MNIESLIDKVLRNKATKEEILIVEKWKAETKANLDSIKEMQTLLNSSHGLESYKEFDKKVAWNKIDQSIEYEEVTVEAKNVKFRWYSMAAAIVILITASFVVFSMNSNENQWTANSEMQEINLDDGSKVWLNTYSSIQSLTNFENSRELSLNGEAYFDVTHSDITPFIVKTNGLEVEVLGTEFNIKSGKTSTQVYVSEGEVKINGLDDPVLLIRGQMLNYTAGKLEVYDSGNQHLDDWKDGKLVFRSFPLADALEEIGKKYNVSINVRDLDFENCKINSSFHNESIVDVMEELKLIFNMDYKILDRNVDILSINCD